MKIGAAVWCVAVAVAMVGLAGCAAAPLPPSAIPTGQWEGSGVYVDYEAVLQKDGKASSLRQAKDKSYYTTLQITGIKAFGQPAWEFYVLSKRGPLMNVPDDKTEARFTLVELKTLTDGSTLYGILAEGMRNGLPADAAATAPPADAIAAAASVRADDALILQVFYDRPGSDSTTSFTDTFRFEAGRVVKTGAVCFPQKKDDVDKQAKVWWVEELRPRK